MSWPVAKFIMIVIVGVTTVAVIVIMKGWKPRR